MRKKISDIYEKSVTLENVKRMWEIVRKTCKNRRAVYAFKLNKNANIYTIYNILLNKRYKPSPFRLFLIFEPKARLVMSQTVGDKIVNHFITNFFLLPYLERKLIDQNVATRKEKGSEYAHQLIVKYLNTIRIKEPNKPIFCLKLDISKYFYTIDHNILMEKIKKDIEDPDVLDLIKICIDETNKPYVNETIVAFNKKYDGSIPLYKEGVGLSIGAMSSQFFAVYYLNDLDHYIKETLHCKYYIRYMDDFIILDTDKEKLKHLWKDIEREITKLNLKLNPKSNIIRLTNGLNFLGYRYVIEHGKLKVKYRNVTYKKVKKKLKILEEKDKLKYYKSYSSYYGYLKKVNKKIERKFDMSVKEKYDYFKEKYPKHIVFIKSGSFYKTFEGDANIVWHLFKYTWNNGSIAFGASPYSTVLDKLSSLDLSYVVVDEKENVVNRDDAVYDLTLQLANISYEKFQKKENLNKKVESVLNKDFANYEKIMEFLESLESTSEEQ